LPHGGVTAGHPLAAMAGTRMLMQGGSAADAVVAAMAVMNVVEPWASSAGGNDFATCLDRKAGKVHSLAFPGRAPDRKSVVSGKCVSLLVDHWGSRFLKKK